MESDLQELADKAVRFATDSGTQYCDIRAEHYERKEALIENINTVMSSINKSKPSTAKGKYVTKFALSLTMSPSVIVDSAEMMDIK